MGDGRGGMDDALTLKQELMSSCVLAIDLSKEVWMRNFRVTNF